MIPRFRMIAGPNGSGKTTLFKLLTEQYAVNFYTFLNADTLFVEAKNALALRSPLPIGRDALDAKLTSSSFSSELLEPFHDGRIVLADGLFRFSDSSAVTTYTISFITNFIREQMVNAGQSCSQETVFSHTSKAEALRMAKDRGFRTYLYFIATDNPGINLFRVKARVAEGGHDVPSEKIIARYFRSLENIASALPYLDRAYFFDASGLVISYLAEYEASDGFTLKTPVEALPSWFSKYAPLPKANPHFAAIGRHNEA